MQTSLSGRFSPSTTCAKITRRTKNCCLTWKYKEFATSPPLLRSSGSRCNWRMAKCLWNRKHRIGDHARIKKTPTLFFGGMGGGPKSNRVTRDGGSETFFGKFYYMYGDLLSLNIPGESGSRSAHNWSILYHRYIDLFLADRKLHLMLTYTSILLLQEVLVF